MQDNRDPNRYVYKNDAETLENAYVFETRVRGRNGVVYGKPTRL